MRGGRSRVTLDPLDAVSPSERRRIAPPLRFGVAAGKAPCRCGSSTPTARGDTRVVPTRGVQLPRTGRPTDGRSCSRISPLRRPPRELWRVPVDGGRAQEPPRGHAGGAAPTAGSPRRPGRGLRLDRDRPARGRHRALLGPGRRQQSPPAGVSLPAGGRMDASLLLLPSKDDVRRAAGTGSGSGERGCCSRSRAAGALGLGATRRPPSVTTSTPAGAVLLSLAMEEPSPIVVAVGWESRRGSEEAPAGPHRPGALRSG